VKIPKWGGKGDGVGSTDSNAGASFTGEDFDETTCRSSYKKTLISAALDIPVEEEHEVIWF
jgi:hypothetical protein